MNDKDLHFVTIADDQTSKPIRVFESSSDFENASNLKHVFCVSRCEGTKLITFCTLIK